MLMRGHLGGHGPRVLGLSPISGSLLKKLNLSRSPHHLVMTSSHLMASSLPLQMLTALLSSSLAFLGALICFITSGVALKDGPFCMFDVSSFNQTQAWKYGYPFQDLHNRNYLYDHSLWNSVCLEPSKAVIWHVSFFSTLLCISLLQILLVVIHFINSFLGLFCSLCEK
uniref:Transmembrane 4 L six family member 19 n=1 Tax=Ursus americanus TaxID=9643 RepID=A0A452QBN2_URSAM